METDIVAADRGELTSIMDPLIPSIMDPLILGDGARHRGLLTDLAFDLTQKSAGFRRCLPESVLPSLADLVRSMNCYYSNLIEGHVWNANASSSWDEQFSASASR